VYSEAATKTPPGVQFIAAGGRFFLHRAAQTGSERVTDTCSTTACLPFDDAASV